MSVSLLSTKLYIPPARSGLISRTRLIDRVNEGGKGKLTLVSAPAGFGKTTLLSDWIDNHGIPVAWLSLEKGDNDPGRFWTYVLAAIRTIHPDLGKNAFELQFSTPQSQIDAVLTLLINEIDRKSTRLVGSLFLSGRMAQILCFAVRILLEVMVVVPIMSKLGPSMTISLGVTSPSMQWQLM